MKFNRGMKIRYLVVVVFLVLISPAILAFGIRSVSFEDQPPHHGSIKVYGDVIILQVIAVSENNIRGIGVTLRNPNLVNKEEISVSLYDQSGNFVRQSIISGKSIPDGAFIKFLFPLIPDSQGKTYVFEMTSPSSVEESAFEIYFANQGSGFKINEETREGQLSIVPIYQPESISKLIINIYQGFWRRLVKDTGFLVFYLIVVAGLLSTIVLGKKNIN